MTSLAWCEKLYFNLAAEGSHGVFSVSILVEFRPTEHLVTAVWQDPVSPSTGHRFLLSATFMPQKNAGCSAFWHRGAWLLSYRGVLMFGMTACVSVPLTSLGHVGGISAWMGDSGQAWKEAHFLRWSCLLLSHLSLPPSLPHQLGSPCLLSQPSEPSPWDFPKTHSPGFLLTFLLYPFYPI